MLPLVFLTAQVSLLQDFTYLKVTVVYNKLCIVNHKTQISKYRLTQQLIVVCGPVNGLS